MKSILRRRGFLSRLTKSVFAVGIGSPALAADPSKENKKVKLLTPKGKLIELDQKILDQKGIKRKATNQDILDWSEKIES